ncbi:indole-3-glycerol-phosphate synthase, partial [Candidatus Daviesbacteria bacterium]|nr:indole-3-glycerol-phosphate synthase [Candidatus Daviesbacteria bacterium]
MIAEIKLASPTEKNLGSQNEILQRALEYEKAGADAISCITEKSVFKGNVKYIPQIKSKVKLPLLQKDFILDPYQIYESKISGADALLLIAKILSGNQLVEFVNLCFEIGIEPVVEINDEQDLKMAMKTETKMIAVNARNIDTLKVDLERAIKLLLKVPEKYIKLGFSGIVTGDEVTKYKKAGA